MFNRPQLNLRVRWTHMHYRRSIILLLVSTVLGSCIRSPAHHTGSRVCAAAPKIEDQDPLFGQARDILTNPRWAGFRREHGIAGDPNSVAWVTDDRVCNQVVGAIGPQRQAADQLIPVAVIRAGNLYLARENPLSQSTVLDANFKVLTVFVSS